jgi:tetratricopeptide (TPR) repeat protein
MVNTVFQSRSITYISSNNNNNTSNGSVNTIQAFTINKNIKLVTSFIDQLYIGTEDTSTTIGNALDVIMQYLYDSSIMNNTFSHTLLIQNTSRTFQTIIDEMDQILDGSDFFLLTGEISNYVRSLLDGSFVGQSDIKDTITRTYDKLQELFEKIKANDLSPYEYYKKQVIQYDHLKNHVLDSLNLYITYFKEGKFTQLKDEFTETQQNEIGQKILSDTLFVITQQSLDTYVNTDQVFDQYRSFIFQLIDGLNSAISLDHSNRRLVTNNNTLQGFSDILNDPILLNEYIETNYGNNNNNTALITETLTLTTQLELKPEYEIYVELYGFPSNGIYDSNKLQTILQNL